MPSLNDHDLNHKLNPDLNNSRIKLNSSQDVKARSSCLKIF